MSDSALEFAEERGLGAIVGRVRLGSGIPIEDGMRVPASLVLSSSGLWLVAARDRFHGVSLDLLTRADLRLSSGRVTDRLCFGQEALTIPAGRRHAVEQLIALARLAAPIGSAKRELAPSRFVQTTDELGRAFLARDLAADEVLICWLAGKNSLTIASHVVGETQVHPYLLVTERRAAIVAWSSVGDVSYAPLHASTTRIAAQAERVELSNDSASLLSRHSDAGPYRDAFELLGLEPAKARLYEAARRLWLGAERARNDAARSLSLLDESARRGSQHARFARLLASAESAESAELDGALDRAAVRLALGEGNLAPPELADLWTSFRFSKPAGSALVRALIELGEVGLPFALALQRRIYDVMTADEATARDELSLLRHAVAMRLASATCPDARDRALGSLLLPRGLAPQPAQVEILRGPLSDELIETTLCHPLARGHASLVASAQKLIALHPEPDQTQLSDYCEALDQLQHPSAKNALDAARSAFSLPKLHAYISRGKKSIGLRGYEAKAPYILLGKAHLDPSSPFCMNEAELCFAIGSEALHLKLGQARITSNEVWAGAFARTKGGVELVLGLLPLLKGLPLAASAAKILERIPEPALRHGLELLVRLEQTQRKPPAELSTKSSALSHINENLVAAHRLMQMNADRAGLVLCGDLRASVRALLLVRPDTCALLEAMIERELVSELISGTVEPALRADLIVRVASLLDFYAGEEYLQMRAALGAS